MNNRSARILLWSLSGAFAAGAVVFAVAGLLEPLNVPIASAAAFSIGDAHVSSSGAALEDLAEFEPLWSLDLQRVLFDPPPPAPPPQVKPPALALKLTGLVVEPTYAAGIFLLPDGRMEMKSAGETLAGAEILKIEEKGATVCYHGETILLPLQKEGQD